MNEEELKDLYFEWLCSKVCVGSYSEHYNRYITLLENLDNTTFVYFLPMDGNRFEDGMDLRYRFADEENISQAAIASYIDIRPCSVLEMMVALAIRCEETIMFDPNFGDRTGRWFWDMIRSLGLESFDEGHFDKGDFLSIISKFESRDYDRSGKGGLFTVNDPDCDMRLVEIWYQLNWYLNEIIY